MHREPDLTYMAHPCSICLFCPSSSTLSVLGNIQKLDTPGRTSDVRPHSLFLVNIGSAGVGTGVDIYPPQPTPCDSQNWTVLVPVNRQVGVWLRSCPRVAWL